MTHIQTGCADNCVEPHVLMHLHIKPLYSPSMHQIKRYTVSCG